MADEPTRSAALLRLVDAAEVAGAVLLFDDSRSLVADPLRAATIRARLALWDGGVVLLDDRSGGGPG